MVNSSPADTVGSLTCRMDDGWSCRSLLHVLLLLIKTPLCPDTWQVCKLERLFFATVFPMTRDRCQIGLFPVFTTISRRC